MKDMLVKLYDLPKECVEYEKLKKQIDFRRPLAAEKYLVNNWVNKNFGEGWKSEVDVSFSKSPISTYIAIKDQNIKYVILDTLSDIFGGSEIIRSQVNYFMKAVLGKIIRETGCSILVSGHPSVSGSSVKGGFSGSTAWQGATRSLWFMQKNAENLRELIRLKSNYSISGEDIKITLDYSSRGVFIER